GEFRSLLRDHSESAVESFPSMALDLQLQPGFGYVLFGEPPQTRWPGSNAEIAAPAEPAATGSRRNVGPVDISADQAVAPVTLGEFMLMGDGRPPMRGMMVFIPRIAPQLFPPQDAVEPAVVGSKPIQKSAESGPVHPVDSQVSRKGGH